AGEDFSNNLFSDLAPLLALFGDQVAKQFMSQSMSWIEDVIFASAPLGILTAVVGAIRVGGPNSMKAIIGRAREPKGMVEMELLSSTSSDVCELWDGEGVVRVMGASPVIGLFYPESTDSAHLPFVYDFDSARCSNMLSETGFADQPDGSSEREPLGKAAPNIALNVSGRRVSDLELMVVAVTGILLQVGVIVFAGFSVLSSPWNENLKKGDKPAQLYAFPLMCVGTVAVVFGVFICAYIVERSTTEVVWKLKEEVNGARVKVAWLQRGGIVNDQQFDSYFIQRSDETPGHIGRRQATLTIIATIISLCGFVAQFVGLRGLNWSVTIAQLVATAIMTTLRAMLRRNLVEEVSNQKIENGYE
ncbi:hypothetical protein BDD12DRAFT_644176, partial [Trichophaea hybrida]